MIFAGSACSTRAASAWAEGHRPDLAILKARNARGMSAFDSPTPRVVSPLPAITGAAAKTTIRLTTTTIGLELITISCTPVGRAPCSIGLRMIAVLIAR